MSEVKLCEICGFPLNARPHSRSVGGVCLACVNNKKKKTINWEERKQWLTNYVREHTNADGKYDIAVGVSGGKDSTTIVRRLIENHHVSNERILCIHLADEFTPSEAGIANRNNLVKYLNVDIIDFRFAPSIFVQHAREGFFEELNPLKWFETQLYEKTLDVARIFDIHTVVMGENSRFEYGEDDECEIFHVKNEKGTSVLYMGAIWPYSTQDSLKCASEIGFKPLNCFSDWDRVGCGDDFSQIDSYGYVVHLWLKFIKFGFQRVTDMACRFVREGTLSREQALQQIKDWDWQCDPKAKKDFIRTLGITELEFDNTVDKFANTNLLIKDVNGNWRRRDLL